MKEFLNGLLWFVGALIVFTILIVVGSVYNVLHALYLSITLKDWKSFFKLIWKMVDGLLATVGYILTHLGIAIDMLGNVNGELLEDMVTTEENTHFGEKTITISATLGEIEKKGWKKSKFLVGLSKTLNWFFNEKYHTVYAWEYYLLRKEFKDSKEKNK